MHHQVYEAAREVWNQAADFRSRRLRYKRFTYGRQWDDLITTPEGHTMSEGDYAATAGKSPLTNNMIRQLVKSIVGRYRYMRGHQREGVDATPRVGGTAGVDTGIARRNSLEELDCRMLEEFLISGCAVQRVVRERRPGHRDTEVWVDNVSPARFFVNAFSDPRGGDIELVGMLHDMSLGEVIMRHGHGEGRRIKRIRDLYGASLSMPAPIIPIGGDDGGMPDFTTAARGKCRVIEAWALESVEMLKCHDKARGRLFYVPTPSMAAIDEINSRRAAAGIMPICAIPTTSMRWHGYYFTPGGELLDDTLSPYGHGSHPFIVKLYPLIDGEVHPFVEDVIDQQKYINRLITVIDHILNFSAKGVLLFPEEQKLENMTWQQVAQQWCRPNGIIPYNATRGNEPKQIFSAGGAQGAHELLNTELKLFEQISGVSSALQGHTADSKTSAELYQSQIQNAAIALLDTFETFDNFIGLRNSLITNT